MRTSPLTEYQRALLEQARAIVPGPPPPPWETGVAVFAGGALAAGWTHDEHIVVISTNGYSVSNPATGERLVRDRDEQRMYTFLSPDNLSFALPDTDEQVRIFGVWGGDGSHVTSDGWNVEAIYPWWPEVDVVIWPPRGPGGAGYFDGAYLLDLAGIGTWRGCGFSPSGKYLMLLDSAGAQVYYR